MKKLLCALVALLVCSGSVVAGPRYIYDLIDDGGKSLHDGSVEAYQTEQSMLDLHTLFGVIQDRDDVAKTVVIPYVLFLHPSMGDQAKRAAEDEGYEVHWLLEMSM